MNSFKLLNSLKARIFKGQVDANCCDVCWLLYSFLYNETSIYCASIYRVPPITRPSPFPPIFLNTLKPYLYLPYPSIYWAGPFLFPQLSLVNRGFTVFSFGKQNQPKFWVFLYLIFVLHGKFLKWLFEHIHLLWHLHQL